MKKLFYVLIILLMGRQLILPAFVYAEGSEAQELEESLEELRGHNSEIMTLIQQNGKMTEEQKRAFLKRYKGSIPPELESYLKGETDSISSPQVLNAVVKGMLKDVQGMDARDVDAEIDERFKGTVVGRILKNNPKIKQFFIRMVQDPDAIPSLTQSVGNYKKMALFLVLMIGTIVLGFYLRFKHKQKKYPNFPTQLTATVVSYLFRFVGINILRFLIYIAIYGDEMGPTFRIFKEVFLW